MVCILYKSFLYHIQRIIYLRNTYVQVHHYKIGSKQLALVHTQFTGTVTRRQIVCGRRNLSIYKRSTIRCTTTDYRISHDTIDDAKLDLPLALLWKWVDLLCRQKRILRMFAYVESICMLYVGIEAEMGGGIILTAAAVVIFWTNDGLVSYRHFFFINKGVLQWSIAGACLL